MRITIGALTFALGVTAVHPAQPTSSRPISRELAEATFDSAWTIVYRTHFDTTFNGVNWLGLREEFRPRASRAATEDSLRAVVRQMLARLRQSHFVLLSREALGAGDSSSVRGDASIGLDVRLVGDTVLVTRVEPAGAASAAGVRPGWVVRAIDTVAVTTIVDSQRRREDWRSLELRVRSDVMRLASGRAGSSVRLALIDGRNETRTIALERRARADVGVRLGYLPPISAKVESARLSLPGGRGSVGVISLAAWMAPAAGAIDSAMDRLRDTDGIVFDVRGNRGGMREMILGVAGYFVDSTVTIGRMRTRTAEIPYVVSPRRVNLAGDRIAPYRGPLAIIVDEVSASASENFSGSLQGIGRARVFGTRTTGGVLPSVSERLPNGDALQHAIADYVTAGGVRLEGRGVIPDEVVGPSRAELLAGRDPALDAAVRWIASRRQPTPAEVVARYVTALGGREALLRREGARVVATVEIPAQGVRASLSMLAAPPRTLVTRLELPGYGTIQSGYDGTTAWAIHPALGASLLDGVERAQMRRNAEFHSELHESPDLAKLETVGRTTVEGRECLTLRVTTREGERWLEHFDASTGLLAGTEETRTTPAGEVRVTSVMSDYRRIGATLVAMRSVQRTGAAGETILTLSSVEYRPIPTDSLALPAAIKTLTSGK